MISRMTGTVASVDEGAIELQPTGGMPGMLVEVLLPAYLAAAVSPGQSLTLFTHLYLEGQGQGTSFVPRLLGFSSASDREFFEALNTVKGIGNRKALRILAMSPAEIASAIESKDARALQELPEVGKRLAETIIAELGGKVGRFVLGTEPGLRSSPRPSGTIEPKLPPEAEQAVEALMALGEVRGDAQRAVLRAIERAGDTTNVDRLLELVFASR